MSVISQESETQTPVLISEVLKLLACESQDICSLQISACTSMAENYSSRVLLFQVNAKGQQHQPHVGARPIISPHIILSEKHYQPTHYTKWESNSIPAPPPHSYFPFCGKFPSETEADHVEGAQSGRLQESVLAFFNPGNKHGNESGRTTSITMCSPHPSHLCVTFTSGTSWGCPAFEFL